MSTATQSPPVTPEELERMADGVSYELVDGRLKERNSCSESSWIAGQILHCLGKVVRSSRIGLLWPPSQGYQCFPDDPNRVRKPDVSFIRSGRLPDDLPSKGFESIPPDLAVEVMSPNDEIHKLQRKVTEYLDVGVPLVWVVNPELKQVMVYRADGSVQLIRDRGVVSGEDVIPGFECPTSDFFPKPIGTPEQA